MFAWWMPAGQPPGQFLSMIGEISGRALASGVERGLVVTPVLLCINADSRDTAGSWKATKCGRLVLLLLVLTMIVVRWSGHLMSGSRVCAASNSGRVFGAKDEMNGDTTRRVYVCAFESRSHLYPRTSSNRDGYKNSRRKKTTRGAPSIFTIRCITTVDPLVYERRQ